MVQRKEESKIHEVIKRTLKQIFFQRKFAYFPYKRLFDYAERNKLIYMKIKIALKKAVELKLNIKICWLQNQKDFGTNFLLAQICLLSEQALAQ